MDIDMEGCRFNSPLLAKQEDSENSPENSGDSPRASMFNDSKTASTSSPKRSRRAIEKRVVSVPIKDVDGSRLKGEISTPPSDSWAWRKYGQKPIKGSPYPRGYYRCSSSKGCPARKQVERSRNDPNVLLVTYSCEHNHPWPSTRNNHHNHHNRNNVVSSGTAATTSTTTTTTTKDVTTSKSEEDNVANLSSQLQEENSDQKFSNLGEAPLVSGATHEFGWLSDFECTSSTMLESPILAEDRVTDMAEMNMFCSMREEDESLFADLGELPECSLVFRRGMIERDEERPQYRLTPWCGTTS